MQLLDGLRVVTEILLAANKDDGKALAEVKNLGDPLLLNVIKGVGRVDSEADQDDMGVRVGERTETVIVLLTSGIPKSKLDVLSVDLDIGDVVLEDSGDVHLREGTLGEDDEKTSLTAGTVTHDDKLAADLSHGLGSERNGGGECCDEGSGRGWKEVQQAERRGMTMKEEVQRRI